MLGSEDVTVQLARISAHAIDRAFEKYGLAPSDEEWASAVADLLNGRSVLLSSGRDHDARCERHVVELCGIPVRVVWNPSNYTVVTLLAPSEGLKYVRRINSRRIQRPVAQRRAKNILRHEMLSAE